ncbi:MAG: Tn3 family transposase, partial [Calditrichota bacterium]
RYAVLLSFLHQQYRITIDEMIDMFDKLINKVHKRAVSDINIHMRTQRKQVITSLSHYRELGSILLDKTVPDTLIRQMIFEKVQRETLQTEIEEVDAYLTGKHAHPFKLVVSRYSYLRQFIPALLKFLKLDPEVESSTDLIQAMQLLIRMNAEDKRKLPEDTPVSFIPKRIQALVIEDGQPQRAAWECALITSIRDEIKSGNLSVKKSKQFGNLDSFFMPYDQWKKQRETFFARSGLPQNPQDAGEHLTQRLDAAYDRFLKQLPENNHLKIHEDGWRLATDKAEALNNKTESSLKQFKEWLADKMRIIKLPELLIEVNNELHFTRYFMVPAKQTLANAEDICAVLATIMAHGCNIGTYTMSHLTDDISYPRIKQITDWMLTDEAQRSALAQVVNAIGNIEVTKAWGHGQTSSSDGQRFAFRRKVLQQTYSASFNDFAIEFYSFVADNYAPFYSVPIECTDRDAPYVLDGLLYNESDLPLKEHYTDTHGYTENNFAAFAMLGRRFSPRIRGLHKQRIYRINRDRDYGPLESILSRSGRTVHLNWITEQWDRIGHFYASLESGHTTASTAMKRLNGFSGKNHFYRANRELGRILKTEHILEYMSNQSLRQRTRRGLLKSEQIHALARDLNYGKRGRINNRDWSEQQTSSSCLTLIIACIIFWQAREINRVIEASENPDLSSLEHISPVSWD